MIKNAVYLLIAHGSRDHKSNEAFLKLVEKFQGVYPSRSALGAFLELAKPSISDAIQSCAQSGAKEIFVIPFMLLPGRHVKEDIPNLIQDAKASYPEVDFHYASPLGEHPLMLSLLEEKAREMEERDE